MTIESLLLSIAMAIAAGLVGSFAVMKRMSLAADPLSHVALPGIGIALALHIHPIFGAVATLVFGALLIWAIEEHGGATMESVIGVVFSAALAIGSLMTTGENLIEALFGGAGTLSLSEKIFGLSVASVIVLFIVLYRNSLIIMMVSPDIARTAGINVRRFDLLFLESFALTIALGLRYLGVLLMGALIIIPAATAKRLAHDLNGMMWISVVLSVISTTLGSAIAVHLHGQVGPIIVLVATALFLLSLLPLRQFGRGFRERKNHA
jgi:ABC-type Mn2+/Zn2+ transport system permease subunit